MANLPEKNVVLVDKITNVPTDSNLFINANGEFKQASVNDVVKSSTVVSSAVETAINTAVQDSIDSNFKQTSGSPILLTDSADGTLIDFKGKGRSTQKQYSGKNLLKPTISTGNASGVTFTKNSDGSYTVNGTNTETTEIWQSLGDVILADEDYIVSSGNYGKGAGVFINGSTQTTFDKQSIVSNSDKNKSLKWGIGVKAGVTLNNVIIYPQLEVGTVATDYEPYVGGVASPNPDYPQAIKSVADSGYFDGELLQGYYNSSTGEYVFQASGRICSKNPIPCKSGDVVKIVLENNVSNMYICCYGENGYISMLYGTENANFIEKTIPNGATYFTFWAVNSGMTVDTVGHITVTINGKYALIVKSKGKNLLNINEIDKDTKFFSYTKYTNEIVKATAAKTSVGEFICSFSAYLEKGKTYTFSYESINGMPHVYIYYDKLWGNRVSFFNISYTPNYTHNVDSGIYIIGYFGAITSGTEYSIVKPMLRRAEVTDDTYEPYKETVSYIPLNEPLRSSLDGSVTDEVSLTECKRKFGKFVLNGTENWYFTANTNMYMSLGGLLKPNGIVISDYYVVNKTKAENTILVNNANVIIYDKRFATVDKWKAWLAENNVTLIYELAEPITETIEPVDIVTYDNVTYLTASDNAEMEIEYPTTKVAGIASIGYSKGRKAEYETEQLKKQLLEIQATIVNTL